MTLHDTIACCLWDDERPAPRLAPPAVEVVPDEAPERQYVPREVRRACMAVALARIARGPCTAHDIIDELRARRVVDVLPCRRTVTRWLRGTGKAACVEQRWRLVDGDRGQPAQPRPPRPRHARKRRSDIPSDRQTRAHPQRRACVDAALHLLASGPLGTAKLYAALTAQGVSVPSRLHLTRWLASMYCDVEVHWVEGVHGWRLVEGTPA